MRAELGTAMEEELLVVLGLGERGVPKACCLADGMVQVVKHLPGKCEALSSNPVLKKVNKKAKPNSLNCIFKKISEFYDMDTMTQQSC
jgi:hypothetical protein